MAHLAQAKLKWLYRNCDQNVFLGLAGYNRASIGIQWHECALDTESVVFALQQQTPN